MQKDWLIYSLPPAQFLIDVLLITLGEPGKFCGEINDLIHYLFSSLFSAYSAKPLAHSPA
jgi:hypothetical protein